MTDEERKVLASEMIRQVVDVLKDFPEIVFTEEAGAPILVVNAHGSVLHFNPQPWAEKILQEEEERAPFTKWSPEQIIVESTKAIGSLLVTVMYVFGDALWILEKLSHATNGEAEHRVFYKHVQAGVKVSTLHVIDGRLRELLRLPEMSSKASLEDYKAAGAHLQKRDYAIKDSQVIDALRRLEKFSISGLARLLAPDKEDFRPTVYDWMERRSITREDLKEAWARDHPEV